MDNTQQQHDQPKWRLFTKEIIQHQIAGFASGFIQTFISQPFDIVKIRMQTEGHLYQYSNSQCFNKILKEEGILAFFKGSNPIIIYNMFINSLVFSTYELAKGLFKNSLINQELSFIQMSICGSFSGYCKSIIQAPIDKVRIQIQITNSQFKSSANAVRYIYTQQGVYGFYNGFLATSYTVILFYMMYFPVYEKTKYFLKKQIQDEKLITLIGATTSSLSAWTTIYPLDVIKSNIQADNINNPQYKGFLDCLQQFYKKNGIWAFYRGFMPCALRAVPVNISCLFVYEQTLKYCIYYSN